MSYEPEEIARRTAVARAVIEEVMNDGEGDSSVARFVSHHLDELDGSYWQKQTGTPRPSPKQVLDLLELRSHWGEVGEDSIDTFDFTLPDDVTNYVIAVSFDESGDVQGIEMES